ncbi:hypothetical protein FOA43_003223 [Brettanomyces nanus]|uniref:Uncharacterized protein n=1 Tax=Eeniella nana TaxID=13502 RepID=A0A875RQ39_EENNA|nr:uncharacterized protein FOA43_003223 [Brettanomyces nanus]QPG75840.1 hypothetical protein FOA43_003223 [Brettanomyces nanus]
MAGTDSTLHATLQATLLYATCYATGYSTLRYMLRYRLQATCYSTLQATLHTLRYMRYAASSGEGQRQTGKLKRTSGLGDGRKKVMGREETRVD